MTKAVGIALVGLLAGACGYSATSRVDGWVVVQSKNIRLRTNAPTRQAVELVVDMQRMRDAFVATLLPCDARRDGERIEVSAPSSDELEEMAVARPAEYRSWRLPWMEDYTSNIMLTEGDGQTGNAGFQHQLVHHMIGACLGSAPDWLIEGLAMLFQTAELRGDQLVLGRPSHILKRRSSDAPSRVYTRTGEHGAVYRPLPAIATLVSTDSAELYSQGRGSQDRRVSSSAAAWALVRLFYLGPPDLRPRYQRFLQQLAPLGADPVAAFRLAFEGVDLQRLLDDSLDVYPLGRRQMQVAPPRRARPSVGAMLPAETHLHWAWLWLTSRPGPETRARARGHLKEALGDPTTRRRAQLLEAALVLIERGPAAAEPLVDAALRESPGDDELLHARLDLLRERRADPAAIAAAAEELRRVARTADQLCAVARQDVARGDLASARALAARGRSMRPGSLLCRRVEQAVSPAKRVSLAPPSWR